MHVSTTIEIKTARLLKRLVQSSRCVRRAMAENVPASVPVKGPRVSEGQRETVLAFMEEHLQLALRSSELVDRRRLWQQLADALNTEGPVVKTVDQLQD
ncbi:hypothetical protein HPB49_017017 [Dermacentor silvarum]|uniref:Uncharacterized protein n=1 Tax=Dermacentor silvarum TaxID=543639 RepID=A0ACB8E1Q7_DERSI|nr:hypothetical protein HPB49_017017 [Dermacentor silvarum]